MELNELVELITKLVKEKLEALEAADNRKVESKCCCDLVKEEAKAEQQNRCILDKKVITEADIQKLARQGIKELVIDKKAIVTPLAQDSIKIYTIKLIKE